MIEQDKKIRKGLPPKHDATSYQTQCDIVIPAGTILRAIGDDQYAAGVGFGGAAGEFTVTVMPGKAVPAGALKRVTAS